MILANSPVAVATASGLIAAATTALIVPIVKQFCLQLGLIDPPDPRKQHNSPMVRLGGITMVLGFCLALTVIWGLGGFGLLAPEKDQLIWATLAGGLCFYLIGLLDDLFNLSPWPRLTLQILVGLFIWSEGLRIGAIELPWHGGGTPSLVLPDALSVVATVIWLVGITNAINWLDGLDGLAAGVAGISSVGLISVSFSLHQIAPGFLAASLAGCCFGFLRHNFNPARIFMGDGGSYFLGFTLAAISIIGPAKGLTTVSLIIPLLILSLPLADMSAVIMNRLREGRSPFRPDRNHIHHRLLRAGLSHKRTVVLIYAFTQWLGSLALVAANAEMRFLWLSIATAILVSAVINSRRELNSDESFKAFSKSTTSKNELKTSRDGIK